MSYAEENGLDIGDYELCSDWKTADGRYMYFSEMEDSHLLNCFKLTLRREQYPPKRMTDEILKRNLMDAKTIVSSIPDPEAYGTPRKMKWTNHAMMLIGLVPNGIYDVKEYQDQDRIDVFQNGELINSFYADRINLFEELTGNEA